MARGLKFQIKEVEGLYYLCRENKGADQLRGKLRAYREADLRLCFCICKFAKSRFSHDAAHIVGTLVDAKLINHCLPLIWQPFWQPHLDCVDSV